MRLWDYWKHAQRSLESFSPPILQIAMQDFCRVWGPVKLKDDKY